MFRYEINYWDEDMQESATEKGIVSAATYGGAAEKIVSYYGKDNIIDIRLYELEDILTDEDVQLTFEK